MLPDVLDESFLAGCEGRGRSARIESSRRSKSEPGATAPSRRLERVVGGSRRQHEMALVEIAAEPRGPPLDVAERGAAGELLEEVLDQVLLREALDQLDLLDRDSRLVRHGPRQVDLRRAVRRAAGRGARRSRRAASATDAWRPLRAISGPSPASVSVARASAPGGAEARSCELLAARVEEVEMAGGRAEELDDCGTRPRAGARRASRRGRSSRRAASAARARRPGAGSPRRGGRSRSRRPRATRSRRGSRPPIR